MICSYAANRQTYCKPLDSASFRVFLFLDYMLPYLVPFVKGFDKKYFDLYKLHKNLMFGSMCGQADIIYNRKTAIPTQITKLGKEHKKCTCNSHPNKKTFCKRHLR